MAMTPEQKRARARELYAQNKDKRAESAKRWFEQMKADPVKYAEYKAKIKKYHQEHKEDLTRNMRKYYEANKEEHLAYMKEYYDENIERIRERSRERYHEKKAAEAQEKA